MRSWLLSVAAVMLLSRSAAAQPEGAPAATSNSDPEASVTGGASAFDDAARYAWLDAEIKPIEASTEKWFGVWTWGYAWVATSQVALAIPAPNDGLRELSLVGASTSFLGFLSMLTLPNTMSGASDTLAKYDASTPFGQYERRRKAEYILQATASEESYEHSVVPFILASVVNGAAAYILVQGYDQVLGGWALFGAGEVATLLQMFTRPFAATHAWDQYKKGYHPAPASEVPPDQIHLSFDVSPFGVGAHGTF
ncbi:MAG: hypothetical protein ACREJ3_08650 [Polyangiaceae bacterium]